MTRELPTIITLDRGSHSNPDEGSGGRVTRLPFRRWEEGAACRDHDPELWFTPDMSPGGKDLAWQQQRAQDEATAIATCHACPVADHCQASYDALAARGHRPHGIWAGVTARDRQLIRRRELEAKRRETPDA